MDIKAALHVLWVDTCTITGYQEYRRENKTMGHAEVEVLTDIPCKLSFESLQPVNQTETAAGLVQSAKLLIDNEIVIKAGSKITVKHCGRVFEFQQSGEAGIFTNHQEIMLVPFEEYA